MDWFFRLFSCVDEVFARLPVEESHLTEQLDGDKEWLLRTPLAGEPEDVLVEAVDEIRYAIWLLNFLSSSPRPPPRPTSKKPRPSNRAV